MRWWAMCSSAATRVNLDTVQGNKPVVQDLLTGVKGVQLRYLDGNQTWQNHWPAADRGRTPDTLSAIAAGRGGTHH